MWIPSWLEADPSLHPEAVYIEADRFCHQKILLAIRRRTIHTALRLSGSTQDYFRLPVTRELSCEHPNKDDPFECSAHRSNILGGLQRLSRHARDSKAGAIVCE